MTRSNPSTAKSVSHLRHNLLAVLVGAAALGLLALQYDAAPAGGSFDDNVDLNEVTRDISVPTESPGTGKTGGESKNSLHGRTALLMNLMLLQRGLRKLDNVPDYSATFYRRERVKGELLEAEVMQMKLRQKPFSVYMKWLVGDKGRELLYVDGRHDGEMLVRLGGVKGIIPTLKLDPNGERAMKESRYPVTNIGLANLAKKIIDYRRRDLKSRSDVKCRMFDDQTLSGRKCYCFVIEYPGKSVSKDYRKSVVFIDKEWSLPLCVQNFGWPQGARAKPGADLDKQTLVEDYRYSHIKLQPRLSDADFDRNNPGYKLH